MLPALAAALPVMGMAANYFGQESANRTNVQLTRESNTSARELARETNAFNASEAAKNRAWQAEMSNTSMQRAREDLKKAGMNPLLAATNGASTPGGSAASGTNASQSAARVENSVQGAITSAVELKTLQNAMDKQKEEIGLIQAQKNKALVDTAVAKKGIPEADLKNSVYDWIKNKWNSATSNSSRDLLDPRKNDYMEKFNQRMKEKQEKERLSKYPKRDKNYYNKGHFGGGSIMPLP